MYKVLLVDDERLILQGISQVVDWNGAGTVLAGTARNGAEALDKIAELLPDIVITDIAMPVLDGIGLVERCAAEYPELRFVMLTGYKEFDYARKAMLHGVKHYLLKPCNENQIHEALADLTGELERAKEREKQADHMLQRFEKVLPHVKEQFLKEWISNKTYGMQDLEYYQELFGLSLNGTTVRLVLFQIQDSHEYEHLFALQNIVKEHLQSALLSTTIDGRLLFLLEEQSAGAELVEKLEQACGVFRGYYKMNAAAAVGDPGTMIHARRMYRQMKQGIERIFSSGREQVFTVSDIHSGQSSVVDKMLRAVAEDYANEELSLNAIAAQTLYMNPDYLGKLFKKTTGENFSAFLTNYRIAKAKECMAREGDVKVFELAERFGFGGNSQYFSQVFKKVTGQTPTEFLRQGMPEN